MADKKKPILTILLLTYNHETSISAAIDSVLEQKTSYPYEIWILEDCSTDNTLKICEEYAARYPEKIKLIAQPKNTKSQHLLKALQKLRSNYFCILEGDDSWCHDKKVQIAINFLEKNPEYTMFAHDTLSKDSNTGEQKSFVHDILKKRISNPVTFENNIGHLHSSSRIYRNVVDFNKTPAIWDTHIFYAFLDKGPLYYHDEVMSVYNYTGEGKWSSLNSKQQAMVFDESSYKCNKLLEFRHDDFFTNKVTKPDSLRKIKRLLGKKLGWKVYLIRSTIINGKSPLKLS